MLKKIMKKVDQNSRCKLSIEELKKIYNTEYNSYSDITLVFRIFSSRNIARDLIDLYGRDKVALNTDELDESTICYVGDLIIDEKLPTYNLKYVYGSIFYNLDSVYNLENLEMVAGACNFEKIKSAEGLDSLEYIWRMSYVKFKGVLWFRKFKIYRIRCIFS